MYRCIAVLFFTGLKSPSHTKEPLLRNDSVSKKKDKKKEKMKKKKKWLDGTIGTTGKKKGFANLKCDISITKVV